MTKFTMVMYSVAIGAFIMLVPLAHATNTTIPDYADYGQNTVVQYGPYTAYQWSTYWAMVRMGGQVTLTLRPFGNDFCVAPDLFHYLDYLPTQFRPFVTQRLQIVVMNDYYTNSFQPGFVSVFANGLVQIERSNAGATTTFSNANYNDPTWPYTLHCIVKGLPFATSVTYSIN